MCGILGFINIPDQLRLDLISHRGPDDQGIYSDAKVNLGHVRLSIQDLSQNAHQPFISDDENYIIIFNGEIYNQWEIRKQLEVQGRNFKSTSDTEVILQGYQVYGTDIIAELNGIFVFAIYDKMAEKLVVARDRFGVKPFYYFQSEETFGFSSELKALTAPYPSQLSLNAEALADYLRFLWAPGTKTPFQEIKKLLPGRFMEIDVTNPSSHKTTRFFYPGFVSDYSDKSEIDLVNALEIHLTTAVKRQLLSDTPVGFFLSGGLDSSLLVAIAKKINSSQKLQCFTIETEELSKSEGLSNDLYYARNVASHLDVHLEVIKADIDIVRDFDKMIWHLDEPQADSAPLNVLNISRRAKEMGYKVLIGGVGGDDVFSGYTRHKALRLTKYLKHIPNVLRSVLISISQKFDSNNPNYRRIQKLISIIQYKNEDQILALFEWLEWQEVLKLFQRDIRISLKEQDPFNYFRETLKDIPDERNELNKLLYLEMNSFLVDHNFNYTDKMGMAEGVEIRVPYLDNDLVDFSYSIPPGLKLKGTETKYILKKLAERYLPDDVIYRSKAGFGAPVRKWISHDLKPLINERLSIQRLRKHDLFDFKNVHDLVKRNDAGEIDASYTIWALLAIDSWISQFHNNKP